MTMSFNSMIFLWLFLPAVLIINLILPLKVSNVFLLAASLFFYAWGGGKFLILLIVSLLVNWLGALFMDRRSDLRRKVSLAVLVILNLGILLYFKYFDFLIAFVKNISLGGGIAVSEAVLPLGISFYTFQMISYIADVYSRKIPAEKNLLYAALYISYFPKILQGPIGRYESFRAGIEDRHVTSAGFAYGVRRFIYGLAKKVILADQFGLMVDAVLANPVNEISFGLGWYIGILYTLQIYFDFSGYSDMALGLGKMTGFDLPENFNYPYLARNVGEFWRRWHISLSSWFRDYVYIPLGGSRKGTARTCLNLIIVFLLTGAWHGSGLSFIAWGLFYGALQVLERLFLRDRLARLPSFVSYIYMFFVTVTGWTLFRADSLSRALTLLKQMFLLKSGAYTVSMFLGTKTLVMLVIGITLCGPLQALFPKFREHMHDENSVSIVEGVFLILLFAYCIMTCAGSVYSPFIYFRF